MFSLQIQIRNLINRNEDSLQTLHEITVRFASIQTEIEVINGCGGKKLLLQVEEEEMETLMKSYAFGLFSRTSESKYFCILNLEKLKLQQPNQKHQIYFFNDQRSICFQSEIAFNFKPYRPKVPKQMKPQTVQTKTINKPPIPQEARQISSFLYSQSSKQKVTKPPIPPSKPVKAEAKPRKVKNNKKQERKVNIEPVQFEDSDEHYIPPVMEFTNDEDEQVFHVPIVSANLGKKDEGIHERDKMKKKENNYLVENASQIENEKQQIRKKKPTITRQQLREEARRQAEKQAKNEQNIMIPISRGNTFELVPLSSLNEHEIIEYAQQQKFIEEQKRKEERLRKELEEEKKKKKVMEPKRIPEVERKRSSEIKKSKEVIHEESDEEPDYESDFDSISLGNSLIRSRHSVSNQFNSQKKEENESIFESGYSQDFESYSHSMLSNKKRTNSISEISESMKSISQSYRR